MEEDILKYSPTAMFRGTPCITSFETQIFLEITSQELSGDSTEFPNHSDKIGPGPMGSRVKAYYSTYRVSHKG